MSYFNHAFRKAFLATGPTQAGITITDPTGSALATTATTSLGYLTTAGLPTYALNQLSSKPATTPTTDGYIGWFDNKLNTSIAIGAESGCCSAYLAGSTLYSTDKLGPLAGGYQETNKSKMVNPKYVSSFYKVAPCTPQNNVVHIGSTYWTAGGGALTGSITTAGTLYTTSSTVVAVNTTTLVSPTGGTGLVLGITVSAGGVPTVVSIINSGKNYVIGDTVTILNVGNVATTGTAAVYTINSVSDSHSQVGCGISTECCKTFLCGETYSLRVDIKGSPALRFLNHNAYATVDAYTGCCPDNIIKSTSVDSTNVFIAWANALTTNPIVGPFMQIVVQSEDGHLLYAPGTDPAFLSLQGAITWDNYISSGHTTNQCAGLIINGAYVDTKFGDCSFQISDFYEKEPVKIYASEVDLNGDPCTFETLCVVTECEGLQAQGLGETVLRDLALSESYRQSFFATDTRIREITKGNEILSSINRNGLYFRYLLQHNVPRSYNPSGTFDSDQYLLEIYSIADLTQFFTNTSAWLDGCGVCEINEYECYTHCSAIDFPSLPVFNPYNVNSCDGYSVSNNVTPYRP